MDRDLISVNDAARELDVDPSWVRALIANGSLTAEKVAGRWLVDPGGVRERQRDPRPAGRPLSARNAWVLILEASDEPPKKDVDPVALWRMRRSLVHPGLTAMRPRLAGRATPHHLWGLDSELRGLVKSRDVVASGSSAAGELGLELAAPNTLDAYVPEETLDRLIREHALEPTRPSQANLILRAVPREAWIIGGRKFAPLAAVALDLASYPDSRSARVGQELMSDLELLAREHLHERGSVRRPVHA
jgi:hypothetical protein